MRLFFKYLKQKRRSVIACGVFALIFAVSFFLYRLPVEAVIYPVFLCAVIGLFLLGFDYLRVKRKHEALTKIKTITDAMTANFPAMDGIQDADYREMIRLLCEEHAAYQTETNRRYVEMIDYYTVWAHQIKTPIASMRLTLQNEDSALARKLTGDLFRVEQYAEMVLTYLRLDAGSTDALLRAACQPGRRGPRRGRNSERLARVSVCRAACRLVSAASVSFRLEGEPAGRRSEPQLSGKLGQSKTNQSFSRL